MIYKKMDNDEEAKQTDGLLRKLILHEGKFNENITSSFIINPYFHTQYVMNDRDVIIATEDNIVYGYAFIRITTISGGIENHNTALVDGLYVEEDKRGQGVGTRLLEECKKWCKENNVKYLQINVINENKSAYDLYLKEGFSPYETKLKMKIKED